MRGLTSVRSRGGLYDEVRDHLDYMFDVLLEGTPRRRALRSSSLPYCPVLDTILPRENDEMDLNGALYTSMGTAAHTALQAYATMGKYGSGVWGGWKCPRCAHEWRKMCFRPDRCPNGCNDAPIYVEITYNIGMSGHSDLVVQYPSGHWVVHEYKTTGAAPREPKRQHVLQARTYCHMLRTQYRISASYVIIYVGREKLERWPFGPYDTRGSSQLVSDWTSRSIQGFRGATIARKKPTRVNLENVARCRPCSDRATHDEYMARRHEFSRKPCPLLPICSKSDAHVVRQMQSVLET